MDIDLRGGQAWIGGWTAPSIAAGISFHLDHHAYLRLTGAYTRTDLGWNRTLFDTGDSFFVGEPPLVVRTIAAAARLEWRHGPGVMAKPSWDAGPILSVGVGYGDEQHIFVLAEAPPDYLIAEVSPLEPRLAIRPAVGGYAAIWMGQRVALVVEGEIAAGIRLFGPEDLFRFGHTTVGGLRFRFGPEIERLDTGPGKRVYDAPEYLPPWRK